MNTRHRCRSPFRRPRSAELHRSVPRPHDSDIHSTWVGPINTNLYGDGLQKLCNRTQNNMDRIAKSFTKMDPCLKYGIKHWHPENGKKTNNYSNNEKLKQPDPDKVKWHDTNVMFTDVSAIRSLADKPLSVKDDETSSIMSQSTVTGQQISFCYLCSTMEEHRRHMLQHRAKRPVTAKPRIEYIAPRPHVKHKKPEEKEIPIHENLYKVDVFTGDVSEAGTSANVFITIKGSRSLLDKTELKKNRGSTNFCFVRGTKETFFLKGPKLGNLEIVTIEHDGLDKKHSWYLERIEITDMSNDMLWVFWCKQWLSMHIKDFQIRKDLYGKEKQEDPQEYDIEVVTGKKSLSGTDANIFLTLFGSKGTSKKIHLADKTQDRKLFEKGKTDRFVIGMKDIGELKKLRIEHDGKGFASGWYLDRIMITTPKPKLQTYYFLYGGWISKDAGDGSLYREILAKKNLKEVKDQGSEGTKTTYIVTVRTGNVRYAGTDANVFIQMCGENNMTKKLTLDDAKNNFERGMLDEFKLEATDVGPLSHVIIGHDNSGPGAGWFLDEIKVRRYLQKQEIKDYLKKAKKKLALKENRKNKKEKDKLEKGMKEIRDERRKSRRRSVKQTESDSEDESDSSDSESDSDSDNDKKKKHKNRKRSKDRKRGDDIVETRKIPMYEEYTFPCQKWLAKDEGDGLYVRELKFQDKTLYFRE